jgi:ammonia channel protein AmtB
MTFRETFRARNFSYWLWGDGNGRWANVPVDFAGGLPVGQKPTVGMAGLTLGKLHRS